MQNIEFDKRESGIPSIGRLPWGTHFCQFYQSKEELLDILIPYFRAGLFNNEFCVWVTSSPLKPAQVKSALKKAIPGLAAYARRGQIEILPDSDWPTSRSGVDKMIAAKIGKSLSGSFNGLRFACNAFPEKHNTKSFIAYGAETIARHNALAAYCYPRDEFGTMELMEVVKKHRFALVRNAGRWEILESTEARVARDALERNEEKLRSVFENMSEGFAYHQIVLNTRGKPTDYIFLEVNEAFEKLTGLKAVNIIGKRVTQVLPGIEKDPANWIERYGKVALSGKPVHFESYAVELKKWYSVSAFSPHKGYFAVTLSDITAVRESLERQAAINEELVASNEELRAETEERQKTEEALKEAKETLEIKVKQRTEELRKSSERISNILESVTDGFLALDSDWRFTYINKAAETILGIKREFLLGKKEWEMFPELTKTQIYNEQRLSMMEKKSVNFQMEFPYNKQWLEFHMYPAEEGLSIFFKDISEKKSGEEKLREAQNQLERARRLSDIGTLAATVAHELRNPLAAMRMASFNIKRQAQNPLLDRHLLTIEKKISESDQIINNLLFYSRLKQPHYEKVDLFKIMEECQEIAEKRASGNSVSVKRRYGLLSQLIVDADSLQMKELFMNILNNAYEAMQSNPGTIEISAESENNEMLKIYFKDTGIGIDKEHLMSVREPFFTTKAKGTGLGLTVCSQIVNLHNGRLELSSEKGKGTIVTVTLPVKRMSVQVNNDKPPAAA